MFGQRVVVMSLCAIATATVCGCASQRGTPQPNVTTEPLDPIEFPAGIVSQDLEGEGLGGSVEEPPRVFVYLLSSGFDAFAALGFLQELEKAQRVPEGVAGVGFGCWLSVAWATSASANKAEWHGFKWEDFSSLKQDGLLNRLANVDRRQARFIDEFEKKVPAQAWSSLKSFADCPLVTDKPEFRFHSARKAGLKPAQALWYQLQTPQIVSKSVSDLPFFSGLAAGFPHPNEMQFLVQLMSESVTPPQDGRETIVLVLNTVGRQKLDLDMENSEQSWPDSLRARALVTKNSSGSLSSGYRYIAVDLSNEAWDKFSGSSRRSWLLHGRSVFQSWLEKDGNRELLHLQQSEFSR